MIESIVEKDLIGIHDLVASVTDYMPWKRFIFEGEEFCLAVDTFKGDVYLVHESGSFPERSSIRIKHGSLRQRGDSNAFNSLLDHLRRYIRNNNSSSFFYFLSTQAK